MPFGSARARRRRSQSKGPSAYGEGAQDDRPPRGPNRDRPTYRRVQRATPKRRRREGGSSRRSEEGLRRGLNDAGHEPIGQRAVAGHAEVDSVFFKVRPRAGSASKAAAASARTAPVSRA